MSERIAATASIINQTAYQTSKAFYQASQKKPTEVTPPVEQTPNTDTSDATLNYNAIPATQDIHALSSFSAKLAQLDQELKQLHLARAQAELDTEKNVLHFKILRLERQRHEFLKKSP